MPTSYQTWTNFCQKKSDFPDFFINNEFLFFISHTFYFSCTAYTNLQNSGREHLDNTVTPNHIQLPAPA